MARRQRALEDLVRSRAGFDLDRALLESVPMCAKMLSNMLADRRAAGRL
jgi:hypothetical protein